MSHGGDGRAWLHIQLNDKFPTDRVAARRLEEQALSIALQVTGRTGDYDGRVLVMYH